MKPNKAVLLVLLVFVVGFGLWNIAWAFSEDANVIRSTSLSSSSFLPLDYIKEAPVISVEQIMAIDEARAWRNDATLMSISMKFSGGLNYNNLNHYYYTFKSHDQHMIVSNPRVNSEVSITTTSDLFGEISPDPVNLAYLKINFVQALEIVERIGGGEFRINHPDLTATLLLLNPQDSVLSWYVTYLGEGEAEMSWIVNAATGFVETGATG